MAAPRSTTKDQGETRFENVHGRGSLYVKGVDGANKPSVLMMDSVDDSGVVKTWGIWVDSTGDVRIIEVGNTALSSAITNQDGDGTIVGTQS